MQGLNLADEDIRRIFLWIDQDHDGFISYTEYLLWILELLKFKEANGTPCYFLTITSGMFVPTSTVEVKQITVEPVQSIKKRVVKWTFTSRGMG